MRTVKYQWCPAHKGRVLSSCRHFKWNLCGFSRSIHLTVLERMCTRRLVHISRGDLHMYLDEYSLVDFQPIVSLCSCAHWCWYAVITEYRYLRLLSSFRCFIINLVCVTYMKVRGMRFPVYWTIVKTADVLLIYSYCDVTFEVWDFFYTYCVSFFRCSTVC